MTHFTRDAAPTQHADGGGGTRLGSHGRAAGQVRRTGPGHDRRPVTTAGGGHARGLVLPRAAGFWLVAGVLFLLLFASAAASPLYRVYQAQWRFSATTLTAVFAVYVLALLLTLLVFGSLSDYLGRRRVIAVALGPSLAAQVLRSPDLVWGGLVIFLVAGTGGAASVAFRRLSPPTAMLAGCLALLAGAVMTLAAIGTASAAAFLAGTAVAGAGVGTGFFVGAYRVLTALASPGQRAGLVAAIWIIFYLAFSIPVVAAGVATTHFGLHQTAVAYSAALAVLAAAAAGSFLSHRRSQARRASAPAAQRPPSPSASMENRQPGVRGGRRLHP